MEATKYDLVFFLDIPMSLKLMGMTALCYTNYNTKKFLELFTYFKTFYWSIVDLQCFITFCCMAK